MATSATFEGAALFKLTGSKLQSQGGRIRCVSPSDRSYQVIRITALLQHRFELCLPLRYRLPLLQARCCGSSRFAIAAHQLEESNCVTDRMNTAHFVGVHGTDRN